jgi:hypothetical protein
MGSFTDTGVPTHAKQGRVAAEARVIRPDLTFARGGRRARPRQSTIGPWVNTVNTVRETPAKTVRKLHEDYARSENASPSVPDFASTIILLDMATS